MTLRFLLDCQAVPQPLPPGRAADKGPSWTFDNIRAASALRRSGFNDALIADALDISEARVRGLLGGRK